MPLAILSLAAAALLAAPPYPPSTAIPGIVWDPEPVRLGNGVTGDNWAMTWTVDDTLFAAYGDGAGFGDRKPRLTIGFARIVGAPPTHSAEDVPTSADTPAGWGNKGIKASGMLAAGGALYLFVRNYAVDGNWHHSRLASSADNGKTWTWAPWHFSKTFGCPDFVQYGRDYAGARDGFVYVVSQDNDDSYTYDRNLVMARVPKGRVADRAAWEFFAGADADNRPQWTPALDGRKPVFIDPSGTQRVSITYNRVLRRYLLTTSHKVEGQTGPHTTALGVFEAPEPWGPWRTVYYDDHWSDHWTIHHKFPTRWMSPDGRTLWLVFSGGNAPQSAYNCLMVRRAQLDAAR